jgi:hypothetical protein
MGRGRTQSRQSAPLTPLLAVQRQAVALHTLAASPAWHASVATRTCADCRCVARDSKFARIDPAALRSGPSVAQHHAEDCMGGLTPHMPPSLQDDLKEDARMLEGQLQTMKARELAAVSAVTQAREHADAQRQAVRSHDQSCHIDVSQTPTFTSPLHRIQLC